MKISKTTYNYATNRSLELVMDDEEHENGTSVLALFEAGEDCEHMFSFWAMPCGGFSYKGNVYLPEHIRCELPHYMKDERALRDVIDFIAKELVKG